MWEELITRLEAAKSAEEWGRIFKEFPEVDPPNRQPTPDVVVTLQGKLVSRTTVSNADGFYELPCLESTDSFRIMRYLVNGGSWRLRHVNIRVEADGFVQAKEDMLGVPLLTEEGLDRGRRFMKALARYSEEDLREKEDLSLPSLQGNTITGIDIVLKGGVGAE